MCETVHQPELSGLAGANKSNFDLSWEWMQSMQGIRKAGKWEGNRGKEDGKN